MTSSLQLHHSPRDYRDRTDIVVSRMPCQGFEDAQRCLGISSPEEDGAKNRGCHPVSHRSMPFPVDVAHEALCQEPDCDEALPLPADTLPAGNLALALPAKVDGRAPLLFHPSNPSVSIRPLCANRSTEDGTDAGNVTHPSAIFSKFGKGTGRDCRD